MAPPLHFSATRLAAMLDDALVFRAELARFKACEVADAGGGDGDGEAVITGAPMPPIGKDI